MATTTEPPTTRNGFDDAIDGARDRLQAPQLSFELGTGRRDNPDFATLKISGQLAVDQNLLYGAPVTITVTDPGGEVIATGSAAVGYPGFKDHFDKLGSKTVERLHTATIES